MTDPRIVALEQKIASAQAELQALKGEPAKADLRAAPLSQAFEQVSAKREVSVTPILTEAPSLPSLKEMERLFAAVKHLAPWPLETRYDPDKPFRGFCSCFRWLANKGRTEFPNPRFALNFWLDDCRSWLRARNSVAGDLDASTLILAVYASADIKYVPTNGMLGHVWELALSEHVGRPASLDAWRRVMCEGAAAILPPSAPARRTPAPSPVRIYGGF